MCGTSFAIVHCEIGVLLNHQAGFSVRGRSVEQWRNLQLTMFGLTAMANLLGSESILSANGVCNCLSGFGLLPWLGSQAGFPSNSLRKGPRTPFSLFPLLHQGSAVLRAGGCSVREDVLT